MSIAEVKTNILNMDQVKIDPKWALRIPANLATRRQVLPFMSQDGRVLVAFKDPDDRQSLQAISRYLTEPVEVVPADADSLFRAIHRIFQDTVRWNGSRSEPIRIQFATNKPIDPDGENIVALGDEIFHAALIRQATDIHIEPGVQSVYVRLRVDGTLEEYRQLPLSVHNPLVSRFKVMSGMDIAERRAPQDGRFTLTSDQSRDIDVRSATIPAKHGERLTMRLLATQTQDLTLNKLGLSTTELQLLEHAIHRPNGLVLLTGPTGCGKSTTLYAAIRNLIARKSLNIMTIEDPVEYLIDGISQIEVDTNDKVNFHQALRGVLRHDPDVLMIGEIRDEETAETVIKAGLTGHLVFSTVHANSAIGAMTRLMDMKIKPYLIGSVARLFAAQRLVRRLCQNCKRPESLTEEKARALGQENHVESTVFRPSGCRYCAGTGFVGRIGLFELIPFDKELAGIVSKGPREEELEFVLRQRGARLLLDDGLEKLFAGLTTFEELVDVVSPY